MRKKIILAVVASVVFSAIAFTSYRLVTNDTAAVKEEPKNETKRADKFALEELIQVIKKYKEAQTIDAEFTTLLMAEDGKTELNAFEGRYVKDKENLYVQSFGSQNLLNSQYLIAVDDDEEMIFVEKPEFEKKDNFFQFDFLSDIDSLVNLPDSIVFYEKIDGQTAKLTIDIASGSYYKTEMIYNTQSKTLIRVNLYPYDYLFNEGTDEGEISDKIAGTSMPQATMNAAENPLYIAFIYKKLELNKPLNKKWFDESKYFKKVNNELVLTNAYKNYEIEFE